MNDDDNIIIKITIWVTALASYAINSTHTHNMKCVFASNKINTAYVS